MTSEDIQSVSFHLFRIFPSVKSFFCCQILKNRCKNFTQKLCVNSCLNWQQWMSWQHENYWFHSIYFQAPRHLQVQTEHLLHGKFQQTLRLLPHQICMSLGSRSPGKMWIYQTGEARIYFFLGRTVTWLERIRYVFRVTSALTQVPSGCELSKKYAKVCVFRCKLRKFCVSSDVNAWCCQHLMLSSCTKTHYVWSAVVILKGMTNVETRNLGFHSFWPLWALSNNWGGWAWWVHAKLARISRTCILYTFRSLWRNLATQKGNSPSVHKHTDPHHSYIFQTTSKAKTCRELAKLRNLQTAPSSWFVAAQHLSSQYQHKSNCTPPAKTYELTHELFTTFLQFVCYCYLLSLQWLQPRIAPVLSKCKVKFHRVQLRI